MRAWGLAAGLAIGCSGGGAGSCTPLTDGTWSLEGTALELPVTGTLTMDPTYCAFTFSEWSIATAVPDGGTIDGTTVTLVGGGFDDCAGELAASGAVRGTCEDGTSFALIPR
jgi:hypothetical protein